MRNTIMYCGSASPDMPADQISGGCKARLFEISIGLAKLDALFEDQAAFEEGEKDEHGGATVLFKGKPVMCACLKPSYRLTTETS